MSKYGYIRVSTKEQNEARQRDAMEAYGIPAENVIMDKQSGKDFERPGFLRLLEILEPGDELVIKSIDRMGRNYEEILEQWRYLVRERQVSIVVLDMPLLDSRQDRDLTGVLISDIVLQLLSYVAQTEREFIHQRQAEGIRAAKERGVQMGRPPLVPPPEFAGLLRQWQAGQISARAAARTLNIDHHTFLTWTKKAEEREK